MDERESREGLGPAGAEPGLAGGAEAGPGRPAAEPAKAKRRTRARRTYTPDERRAAVEAYLRSGRTQEDFAALWGLSAWTLSRWLLIYEREGPKGLETKPRGRRRGSPGDARRLSESVREEIARTKRRFPDFGLRKVRDFLSRFGGIRVSAGSVRNVLRERGLSGGAEPARRRRRRASPPRRFERAKPGELWQSDITSYVLTRHSTRVYLVVFLDDFSRYVVSWALATQQRGELVCEALLEGVARFGKPREVLTDQGRQYFAWRGKSAFQRLLDREGIAHVVSRTHHPQTLGKCERLWKTVGHELWERTRPQDLAEARERLGHFFAHYNHFRPHQGIGGAVPADRFFGAESALRRGLEERMGAQELALALGEAPRRSVFLFGQVGDRSVSLHGERGRLVIQTDEGGRQELALGELGMARDEHEEHDDERDEIDGRIGERHDDRRDAGEAAQEADGAQAGALPADAAPGAGGAGAVGAGERRGAGEGARPVHGDPGVLGGPGEQGGDRAAAGGGAAAGVAAVAAGGVGDAGGALAPTAQPQEAERRQHTLAQSLSGAGAAGAPAQAGSHGGLGTDPAAPAVGPGGSWGWERGGREEARGESGSHADGSRRDADPGARDSAERSGSGSSNDDAEGSNDTVIGPGSRGATT